MDWSDSLTYGDGVDVDRIDEVTEQWALDAQNIPGQHLVAGGHHLHGRSPHHVRPGRRGMTGINDRAGHVIWKPTRGKLKVPVLA